MLSFTATGIPYSTPDGCADAAWASSALRRSLGGVRLALRRLSLTRRSPAALALANASLGSLTGSPSSFALFELPQLGHQEEAVPEGGGEPVGPERERPGLHLVRAEPHGVRPRYERLHAFARGHTVDLGDVFQDARHLLREEGDRLRAHVELREPRDLQVVELHRHLEVAARARHRPHHAAAELAVAYPLAGDVARRVLRRLDLPVHRERRPLPSPPPCSPAARASGNSPSSSPVSATTGHSSPFAMWTVISVTPVGSPVPWSAEVTRAAWVR